MPRIFVAVPLTAEVRSALAAVPKDPAFRWVPEHQYHITLRFLGDVTEAEAARACEVVSEVVHNRRSARPIHLHAKGLGAFPNRTRPRVVWAGVSGDVAELTELQASLEASLVQKGFPGESRPFRPHITLARTRRVASFPDNLEAYENEPIGSWRVDEIHVIESVLARSGPRYTVVHRASV